MKRKTDAYVKRITEAAIRRKVRTTVTDERVRLWDEGDSLYIRELVDRCEFDQGELPIVYSVVDWDNWLVVTTRALRFAFDGRQSVLPNCSIRYAGPDRPRLDAPFWKLADGDSPVAFRIEDMDGVIHPCRCWPRERIMLPTTAALTMLKLTQG
ncbi:MAG: hypothetical protein AAFX41_03310 [Bacteroidota bacterium]